ncbi:hypothetical protein MGMO_83c00180 [Methyloglobulus morosus KoM1]|uniref:Uncharacterized protein n=1 Tax=Methyloglobulus morosus KoM1 TaxID=1116472 RepID=V5BF69_9GAMM|nr:hypothetical protein [Methyloglobulus morosus]ESS71945.1 hypothetical protein MGMO_83c00180 [Methyloglobulus morosus KoM1]
MTEQTTNEMAEVGYNNACQPVARCPMHAHVTEQFDLKPDDVLFLPRHRRVITQYVKGEDGDTELNLYYEDKEISFDEPELFAFGERLAQQSHFVAETATRWGDGYGWEQVKELLESLIEEGILHLSSPVESGSTSTESRQVYLPPGECKEPRTWFECEAITAELTGYPLEIGYLELVVPIFRVAHIALDMEGRQVGEANVFPDRLRLDVPTEWRACPYPGSRHQDELPMNVTALKSMRKHWLPTMVVLSKIRDAYLGRFPDARQGMTIGHLECLSTLVLALPAYLLMRSENNVNNGSLHPVLSNMFRVTDGVRMTTHQMMVIPLAEATLLPDAPITGSDIYQYAERNYVFQSAHGVCAGPKAMIEEFLSVLVDGGSVGVELDPEVQAALDGIEAAFDYGLYGLRVYVIALSFWTLMSRTYEQLWNLFESWPETGSIKLNEFKKIIQIDVKNLQADTLLATEDLRSNRDHIQASMYEKTSRGLKLSFAEEALPQRIAPSVPEAQHTMAEDKLRSALGEKVANDDPTFNRLIACLMTYFRSEQAIVKAACEDQGFINRQLGRPTPTRDFTAADINLYSVLIGDVKRLPLLSEVCDEVFNLHIVVTQNSIEISDRIAD